MWFDRKEDAISIHSLVKRETIERAEKSEAAEISIHSLVKRETVSLNTRLTNKRFQSTPS